MKKMKLLLTATALLPALFATAQITPTAIGDAPTVASTGVTKTASDSRLVASTPGTAPMIVVANDGSAPSIFYSVPTFSISGILSLPTGATAPDLVLSTNANFANAYLLVVYRQGGSFIFARYKWLGTSFGTPVLTGVSDVSGTYQPNTTIDATKNGDYAYQVTRSNGQIIIFDGSNASLPGPATLTGTVPMTGQQTDICVNSLPGPGVSTNVHVSFTDPTNAKLYSGYAPFSTLSFTAPIIGIAGGPAGSIQGPRIASPATNAPSCPGTDIFSVAYNDLSTVSPGIHLYSEEAVAGATNVNLTSGAAGFPTPATPAVKDPALSYNEKFSWVGPNTCSAGLTAGWAASGFPSPLYGEKLLSNGTINGGITYYEIIPTVNSRLLTVSSKYVNDDILLAYYNGSQVRYKFFSYAAPTLRQINVAAPQKDLMVYPNPSTGNIYINIENINTDGTMNVAATDITGKSVYAGALPVNAMQSGLSNWFSSVTTGVYFVRFSDNEGFTKTIKLVKE